MYTPPDEEKIKKLDLKGLDPGDEVLYCPECLFQIVNAAMKPICPDCGERLRILKVD